MAKGLSTHVLDLSTGRPAAGLGYALFRLDGEARTRLADGATDPDGRAVLLAAPLAIGVYELVFAVNNDFLADVPIRFKITDPERSCHVPLLLSPFGYSTYRGS